MLKKDLLTNLNLNIPHNTYLVVGTSAGPDSMALLHYLMTNTNNPLVVAHINHNKRTISIEEEKYLSTFCKQNNITFESTTIKEYTQNNFENEAREKRYKFYEQILKKYNSKYLFLAHHGDDLVETILMKIARGSNLEGYAGIKTIAQKNNYYIIRPFLEYTKNDLITYNKENNIKYYIDESNQDTTYTRNRYRHHLLPLLKEENPNIHKMFLKYSQTLLEYNTYINDTINYIYPQIINNTTLNIETFKTQHPFLQKNILYKFLNNYYNNKSNIIKESHIGALLNIINNPKPNLTTNLPQQTIARKSYNHLYIEKQTSKNTNYKIPLQDVNTIDNITIKKIKESQTDGNDICRLNSKELNLPLYLRNRLPGDYIETLGLNGKKKIKEIFIEKKVPQNQRDTYPILVDAKGQIIWLPNLKKSKFNSQNNSFYDIILKYCEKEENNEQ